jgi:hypothetical protein
MIPSAQVSASVRGRPSRGLQAQSMSFKVKHEILVPVHKNLHFLKGNGAIVISIHCLENALLGRLPFL